MSGLVKARKTVSPESIVPQDDLSNWTTAANNEPIRVFDSLAEVIAFLRRQEAAMAGE